MRKPLLLQIIAALGCLTLSGCVSLISRTDDQGYAKINMLTVDASPPTSNPALLAFYNAQVSNESLSLLQLYSWRTKDEQD